MEAVRDISQSEDEVTRPETVHWHEQALGLRAASNNYSKCQGRASVPESRSGPSNENLFVKSVDHRQLLNKSHLSANSAPFRFVASLDSSVDSKLFFFRESLPIPLVCHQVASPLSKLYSDFRRTYIAAHTAMSKLSVQRKARRTSEHWDAQLQSSDLWFLVLGIPHAYMSCPGSDL